MFLSKQGDERMTAEELKKIIDDHQLWLNNFGSNRADLTEANLTRANLDFSSFPLWCGGLLWKIDRRIAAQIAYHFCSMKCDDSDFITARNKILDFANQFHRANGCGILMPLEDKSE
jgi:uncharacterized protein YjbI with pentapeptide repeats